MTTAQPIFILSAPRSGSTLLRVMLAGHPKLFCPPELNLAQFDFMGDRETVLGPCPHTACQAHKCDQRIGLLRGLVELEKSANGGGSDLLTTWLERNEPVHSVYDVLAGLAAPQRLVDKSPLYSAKFETMARIDRLFPFAQYIYIHRHPYAVMESLVRNGFEKSMDRAEDVWLLRNENIQKFLASIENTRQIRIAYEVLVEKPEETMRSIASFLQIEFHPALLNPYEGSRMTDGVQEGHMPPGDANFLNHKGIEARLGAV